MQGLCLKCPNSAAPKMVAFSESIVFVAKDEDAKAEESCALHRLLCGCRVQGLGFRV